MICPTIRVGVSQPCWGDTLSTSTMCDRLEHVMCSLWTLIQGMFPLFQWAPSAVNLWQSKLSFTVHLGGPFPLNVYIFFLYYQTHAWLLPAEDRCQAHSELCSPDIIERTGSSCLSLMAVVVMANGQTIKTLSLSWGSFSLSPLYITP